MHTAGPLVHALEQMNAPVIGSHCMHESIVAMHPVNRLHCPSGKNPGEHCVLVRKLALAN